MDDQNVDVSICIVNWNGQDIIKDCINSIYKYRENLNFEIIVVDNASVDKSKYLIESEFPEVILLKNLVNVGFGKANNQAIKVSRGRFIMILNPDIVLIEPCFNHMMQFFKIYKDAGCIGCKMINKDGSIQKSFFSKYPTPLSELKEGLVLNKISNKFTKSIIHDGHVKKVAWIVGACMMFRRSVLVRLNGFDERYFMYGEDVDICYRTYGMGYTIYYLSNLKMKHLHATSSTKKVRKYFSAVMQKESVYRFMKTHYGSKYSFLFRVSWLISGTVRIIVFAPLLLPYPLLSKNQRSFISKVFEKYMHIIFWSFGFEKWSCKQIPE